MYKFLRREILSIQEVIYAFAKTNSYTVSRVNGSLDYFFWTGLSFKLIFGSLLASTFLSDLFLPFVSYFVESGFSNPYEYFSKTSNASYFPYPAMMLYIVTLPKLLFGWIAPESTFFSLFLFRLPIVAADVSIFLILRSWLKEKFHKKLMFFYWLSPILFYISYVHGQLDAIPIALLFGSLFFLFKERNLYSALFLGLALATKTNILIVFPFFFLYMLSKHIKFRELTRFFLVSFGAFFLINLPFLGSEGFVETILFNQEYLKLFNANIAINDLKVYLMPAALLILFVRGLLLRHYNKDIFIMLLGFSFSIVLLFIPPMQGWYFWMIPFLAYFYSKMNGRSHLIYVSLTVCYLSYFLVVKESDYLQVFQFFIPSIHESQNFYYYFAGFGLNVDKAVNLVYTALQTTMLVNCYWIYKEGLEISRKDKIMGSPFLLGIGGNSGVGKTTISEALSKIFGTYNTVTLRGDDMHKWQRSHKKWSEYTHLDPRANYLHKEVNFLKKLKSGQKIYRRHYDHSTGEFTEERPMKSNNLIIYEGLHPFYLPSQRGLYDFRIFIKPSMDLMHHWKILRDRKKRGYSKDRVLETIKKREKDSEMYIYSQKNKAEFIIEAHPVEPITNIGEETEEVDVYYKLMMSNVVYIEPLIDDMIQTEGLKVKHWYTEDDHQVIELMGGVKREELNHLSQEHITGLEDLGIDNPDWPEGLFGALTLILTHSILEKSRI